MLDGDRSYGNGCHPASRLTQMPSNHRGWSFVHIWLRLRTLGRGTARTTHSSAFCWRPDDLARALGAFERQRELLEFGLWQGCLYRREQHALLVAYVLFESSAQLMQLGERR
jgi:hypothetical protein